MKLLILAVLVAFAAADSLPVILWHGMGDDCCSKLSMGRLVKLIQKEVPGVHVNSLEIGDTPAKDRENGFLMNVNTQIDYVCEKIQNDGNLTNGYNAVGFSQGGQFLRALAERCPSPPMKNLISMGGQHQGVFGVPKCEKGWLCETMKKLLDIGAYVGFVQNTLVQAEYWHDPLNEKEYQEKSIFLADINNALNMNETYKKNLLQLEKLVLVQFLNDTVVIPRESEWFGWYVPGQDKDMQSFNETTLYTEDRIGLKTLNEQGKVDFLGCVGDHLQFSDDWFITNIINNYLK